MVASYVNRRAGDAAARNAVRSGKGERTEITRTKFSEQWMAVYDGTRCIGHVLSRGRAGVEAFDRGDNTLGNFPTTKAAADALAKVPA